MQRAAIERRAAQAPFERLSEQGTLVDIGEHFGDSGFRDPSCDAERFEPPEHAPATVSLDVRLRACARERRPAIVQRSLPSQTHDSLVDIVGVELAAFEAEAHLRLTQLTTGQHSQARLVRIGHVINCTYTRRRIAQAYACVLRTMRAMHPARDILVERDQLPPNRVIVGGRVMAARAISSRAESVVLVIPCNRSLNSSGFDAQRSASSCVIKCCS